jgi:putative NADH-flavin reductase
LGGTTKVVTTVVLHQLQREREQQKMMITIFGASGRTGKQLVEQALSAGHSVIALTRNPSKLEIQHDRLKIIQGNVMEADKVNESITGAGAVISVLGPTSNTPTYEVSCGMENIISGMKKNGVKRLIASAGAGVGDPNDSPKLFDRLMNILLKQMARYVYEDSFLMVEKVRATDLDWTLVRVPRLVNGARIGKVRVGYVGKDTGARITRTDMAEFILKQVSDTTHLHKSPLISN